MESTKEKLEKALKEAMRANDPVRKTTVRMVLSSLKLAEVEKGGALDENAQVQLVQKEIKVRQEAIEDARRSSRSDLLEKAEAEKAVLESFLPQQLSEDELKTLAASAIAETGAKVPADMGRVMKFVMTQVQGRAPGDQVSRVVRDLLQNQG
ncbi:MAG TPA: GatB/YqeY domain-containing protein [Anaerolineaceae bacterium]|nr:GatB/YqeY domain-containing protein [Anaerolineaceae bacterium]